MEDPCKLDNLYPIINELLDNSIFNNSEFKTNRANETQDVFIGEIHEQENE